MSNMRAPSERDLALCAISNWYPALQHVSIRTTLLPLDDAFVRYLLADGCFVPADEGCTDRPSGSDAPDDGGWSDDERWSDDEGDSSVPVPRFPELELAIVAAIRKHGGAVMPKLNWSAPKDAAWVLGGSLKCTSPRDVLLLLKSSDHIAHDLCDARHAAAVPTSLPTDGAATAPPPPNALEPAAPEPASLALVPSAAEAVHEVDSMTSSFASAAAALASLELSATAAAEAVPAPLPLAPTTVRGVSAEAEVLPGAQWVLALRRWCNLRPSSEFRCYGLEGGRRLLAVCQRDRFSHYPFLEAECPRLLPLLAAFAERHLGETVGAAEGRPALALPRRLVWDAYVDLDSRVHLIDVAPFHRATDPLLFDWAELCTLAEAAEDAGADFALEPELRLVPPDGGGVTPSAQLYYGLPHELQMGNRTNVADLIAAAKRASAVDSSVK